MWWNSYRQVCDNVSHCGHGEDEVTNNFCSGGKTFKYIFFNTLCCVAGDKVYDLIGLEAGQAAGAVILLFLLLIAGGLKLYIWKYNLTVVMWRLHRRLDLELPSWRSAAGEPEPGTDLHRWEQQVTGEDGVTEKLWHELYRSSVVDFVSPISESWAQCHSQN